MSALNNNLSSTFFNSILRFVPRPWPWSSILKRHIFLYLVLAFFLYFSIDRDVAYINHLNRLKDIEKYLYDFSNGFEEFDEENFFRGVRYYKELLKEDVKFVPALSGLGFCYFYLKDYSKALSYYRNTVQLDPYYYTYSLDLGLIYFYSKEYHHAISYLQNAIAQIPSSINLIIRLGENLQLKGKEEIATVNLMLIKKAGEDEQVAYEHLLKSLFFIKQFKVMREVALLAIKAHDENPIFYYWNGLASFMLGGNQDAINNFNQAIERDPHDRNSYYYRALSYEKSHLYPEAKLDFLKAQSLENFPRKEKSLGNDLRLHLTSDLQSLQLHVIQERNLLKKNGSKIKK